MDSTPLSNYTESGNSWLRGIPDRRISIVTKLITFMLKVGRGAGTWAVSGCPKFSVSTVRK